MYMFFYLSPLITDDVFILKKGRNHVLKKSKVGKRCIDPKPLTWHSTEKSDVTEKIAMIGSVDCCSDLPEPQFVWTCLCVDITEVLSVGGSLPLWELPERGQSLTSSRL